MMKPSIKLTKNPAWAFKTENGITHNITLNKSHPDALENMTYETLKMLYHHKGVKKAQLILADIEQDLKSTYAEINP